MAVSGGSQAFLIGGDVKNQWARAWAVATAAYGCDIIRPALLRKHLPLSFQYLTQWRSAVWTRIVTASSC